MHALCTMPPTCTVWPWTELLANLATQKMRHGMQHCCCKTAVALSKAKPAMSSLTSTAIGFRVRENSRFENFVFFCSFPSHRFGSFKQSDRLHEHFCDWEFWKYGGQSFDMTSKCPKFRKSSAISPMMPPPFGPLVAAKRLCSNRFADTPAWNALKTSRSTLSAVRGWFSSSCAALCWALCWQLGGEFV